MSCQKCQTTARCAATVGFRVQLQTKVKASCRSVVYYSQHQRKVVSHVQRRGLSPLEAVQVMGMGSWRLKGQLC